MPGIFQGDIIIKTAIELGIEDMRKNPWLIDHMLSDLTSINYFVDKYGQKQIDACKEWFKNSQIDVVLRGRDDKDKPPYVTIQLGPSSEKPEMKHMADQSTERAVLMPNQIGKPIPYVIKPFTPLSYSEDTGELGVDDSIDLSGVAPGMILVNPSNGTGYVIQDVLPGGILLLPGMELENSQFGILPQHQYYQARIEHSFFNETYNIGCHAHGDPQNVIWLWSIVKYSILRYRESLLEANGFAESSVSSSPPDFDEAFTTPGGEKVWVRGLSLEGQIENSWVKSPMRFIEVAALKTKPPKNGFSGGIIILSNLDTPTFIDQSQESWITKNEGEPDEE